MADEAKAPAPAQVQRQTAKPESSGAKVTVYCCLPTGLDLRVFKMIESREQVIGGGTRDFQIAEQDGLAVHCNGNRFRLGEPQTHRVVASFGVTEGVDKDLWDRWLEANKDMPAVKNGLIFAAEKREYGDRHAETQSNGGIRSGLEAMLKDGDPRAPRPGANMRGVKQFAAEET